MVHIIIDSQPIRLAKKGKIVSELPTCQRIIENWSSSREGYGKLVEELDKKCGVEFVTVYFNAPNQEDVLREYGKKLMEVVATDKDPAQILDELPDIWWNSKRFESAELVDMQKKINELHEKFWVTDVHIRLKTNENFELPTKWMSAR